MKSKLPHLVFLPGFGFKSDIWQAIAEEFKAFSIHLIDFPRVDHKTSWLEATHGLLEKIPLQSILIAWSFGGLFAIDLCAQYPNRFEGLILVSSLPYFLASDGWDAISIPFANRFLSKFKRDPHQSLNDFYQLIKCQKYGSKDMHSVSLNQYLQWLLNIDLRARFKEIEMPILGIYGGQEELFSLKVTEQMIKLNDRFQLVALSNCGHVPFLHQKTQFINILKSEFEKYAE